jgi:hypothetical protein
VLTTAGKWSGKAPPWMRKLSELATRAPAVSGIVAAVLSFTCFSAFLFWYQGTRMAEQARVTNEQNREAMALLIQALAELEETTSRKAAEEQEEEPADREDRPGVPVSDERTRQEMKREAAEILAALRRLGQAGRQMSEVRRAAEAGDPGASARCGELMRGYQGEARELGKRAKRFGDVAVFRSLSTSSDLMEVCVSCLAGPAEGQICTEVMDENLRKVARRIEDL